MLGVVVDDPMLRASGLVVPAGFPDWATDAAIEHGRACARLADARAAYDRLVVDLEQARRDHRARVREALRCGQRPPGALDPVVDEARLDLAREDVCRAALELADLLDRVEALFLARRGEIAAVVRQELGAEVGVGERAERARVMAIKGKILLTRFSTAGEMRELTDRVRAAVARVCPSLVDGERRVAA
jgi:hypothetical protein